MEAILEDEGILQERRQLRSHLEVQRSLDDAILEPLEFSRRRHSQTRPKQLR